MGWEIWDCSEVLGICCHHCLSICENTKFNNVMFHCMHVLWYFKRVLYNVITAHLYVGIRRLDDRNFPFDFNKSQVCCVFVRQWYLCWCNNHYVSNLTVGQLY